METVAAQTIPQAIADRSAELPMIASDIAEVLAPLSMKTIRARVLDRLVDELRGVLELENASQITCHRSRRPRDRAVRAFLALTPTGLSSTAFRREFDIEVEVDRTRLATRISDWTKARQRRAWHDATPPIRARMRSSSSSAAAAMAMTVIMAASGRLPMPTS
jgi:hypothetical protein